MAANYRCSLCGENFNCRAWLALLILASITNAQLSVVKYNIESSKAEILHNTGKWSLGRLPPQARVCNVQHGLAFFRTSFDHRCPGKDDLFMGKETINYLEGKGFNERAEIKRITYLTNPERTDLPFMRCMRSGGISLNTISSVTQGQITGDLEKGYVTSANTRIQCPDCAICDSSACHDFDYSTFLARRVQICRRGGSYMITDFDSAFADKVEPINFAVINSEVPIAISLRTYAQLRVPFEFNRPFDNNDVRKKRFASIILASEVTANTAIFYLAAKETMKASDQNDQKSAEMLYALDIRMNEIIRKTQEAVQSTATYDINKGVLELKEDIYDQMFYDRNENVKGFERYIEEVTNTLSSYGDAELDIRNELQSQGMTLLGTEMVSGSVVATYCNGSCFQTTENCGKTVCLADGEWYLWRKFNEVETLRNPVIGLTSCGFYFKTESNTMKNIIGYMREASNLKDYLERNGVRHITVSGRICDSDEKVSSSTLWETLKTRLGDNLKQIPTGGYKLDCASNMTLCGRNLLFEELSVLEVATRPVMTEITSSEDALNLKEMLDPVRGIAGFTKALDGTIVETAVRLSQIPENTWEKLTDGSLDPNSELVVVAMVMAGLALFGSVVSLCLNYWSSRKKLQTLS